MKIFHTLRSGFDSNEFLHLHKLRAITTAERKILHNLQPKLENQNCQHCDHSLIHNRLCE